MIEVLQQHIIDRLGKDVANLEHVLNHFKPLSFKRNELVLRQGEICKYVYFVAKGFCKYLYLMQMPSYDF